MSSVLIKDIGRAKRPMYFVIKVFRGAEARYPKIEKLVLVVIVGERKLRPYFHGHKTFVKTTILFVKSWRSQIW